MAINDYCTVAEVKESLPESGLQSSTDYDIPIAAMISAASRLIDREVGRWPGFFYPSTASETRYFDGTGDAELRIDEAISITTVSLSEEGGVASTDYTDLGSTDYLTWPYNATATGQPIQKMLIDQINGDYSTWYDFPKAVKVVGIFGWAAAVPSDVNYACRVQTTRWHMRAKQAYQITGGGAPTGSFLYDALDPDVAMILAHYKLGLSV